MEIRNEAGFIAHCGVAALLLQKLEINPHTKHHVRSAIRQASLKVTPYRGSGKALATHVSELAALQIQRGEKQGLVLEHAVPISHINEIVLREKLIETGDIARVVRQWTLLSIITQAEHQCLSDRGLAKIMPKNWDGEDKLARYSECGIHVHVRNPSEEPVLI